MALAFSQSTTGTSTAGSGSFALTAFGSTVTVGNAIIVIACSDGNAVSQITGVTDSKSNTYVKMAETVNTGQATERYVSAWLAKVTTGGTSNVVTVTYNSASSTNGAAVAQEFSGFTGTPTLDKTAGGGSTTATTTPTTATTAATTQANAIVVGGFVANSTIASFTAGSGYSNAASGLVSNSSACMESKIVAATGTQVATATFGTSRAYGAIIVTVYDATGGGANTTNFFFGMQGNNL